jgi:hypothetical protein
MGHKRFISALVASAAALASASHADDAPFAERLAAAASRHAVEVGKPMEAPPVALRVEAKPTDDILAEEARHAALWTGRVFHARGKAVDMRVTETAIAGVAYEATPEGWKREGTKLIHRESGLECPASFNLAGDNGADRLLDLSGVTAYDRRGRDVSCNYGIAGDATVTVYASYYPTMSLDEHAAGAVAAIRRNFQVKGELPVTVVTVEPKDTAPTDKLPEALSGAFDVGEINGVPYKTAIWIAETHGWHVKTRATYAQTDFMSELTAAILFGVNYVNVDMKNRIAPTASGPEV